MGDRLLEIVVLIMSHIRETQGQVDSFDDISDDLKSQGFTDSEISFAYSWVIDHLQGEPETLSECPPTGDSIRVLSEKERQHFTSEAYGYLLQMKYLNLLSDNDMELILERGGTIGATPIDLDQIKIVIGAVLFREVNVPEILRQPSHVFSYDDDPVH